MVGARAQELRGDMARLTKGVVGAGDSATRMFHGRPTVVAELVAGEVPQGGKTKRRGLKSDEEDKGMPYPRGTKKGLTRGGEFGGAKGRARPHRRRRGVAHSRLRAGRMTRLTRGSRPLPFLPGRA